MNYPGDTADPKDVARWMSWVAENEFGLPGILPVMTSCVELTDAWTAPGNVWDVPGYGGAIDYDSLGYFQQRPSQGWGTPDQLTDADYALRAFCRAAVDEWREVDPNDAYALGEWCADVQRPYEAYRDRYATKGFPMALELLKEDPTPQVWPQKLVEVSSDGWAFIREGEERIWLRGKPQLLYVSDPDGWLTQEKFDPPAEKWQWPKDLKGPIPDSPWYVERHPSRWDTVWREDIEQLARKIVDQFGCSANTYWWHPPELGLDDVSVDFWAAAGRGEPIGHELGQAVFDEIFNDMNPPWIRYCIWERWMWVSGSGWEPYGWDDFSYHDDHPHFSFW